MRHIQSEYIYFNICDYNMSVATYAVVIYPLHYIYSSICAHNANAGTKYLYIHIKI